MSDPYKPLRDRLAAGETVTVADVAAVADVNAADVLAELLDDHRAAEQAQADRRAREKAIGKLLASFESEADRVIDRMEAAGEAFAAAVAELQDAKADLEQIAREHLEPLHRLGWNRMRPGSFAVAEVWALTAGRVIIDNDQLGKIRVLNPTTGADVKLPDGLAYAKWARSMQAERPKRRG